jgi:hypothetical protein
MWAGWALLFSSMIERKQRELRQRLQQLEKLHKKELDDLKWKD